jgi:hypothetical protein
MGNEACARALDLKSGVVFPLHTIHVLTQMSVLARCTDAVTDSNLIAHTPFSLVLPLEVRVATTSDLARFTK